MLPRVALDGASLRTQFLAAKINFDSAHLRSLICVDFVKVFVVGSLQMELMTAPDTR